MRACDVDLDLLRDKLTGYIDNELSGLVLDSHGDAQPTAGFQRVIHRAVAHVQSSGREEVTGANVLVAIFAERESHAAFFLQEQHMTRFDAVNYISHGIAKRGRHVGAARGARCRRRRSDGRRRRREEARRRCARGLLHQPEPEGPRWADRSADRPRARDPAHHPGALPPSEEQPAFRGRSGRRQDGHRRRLGAPYRHGRRARGAAGFHDLPARHGRAARRHPLSRRFRGAAQGRDARNRELSRRHHVHRRDPHGDRGRAPRQAAPWMRRTC